MTFNFVAIECEDRRQKYVQPTKILFVDIILLLDIVIMRLINKPVSGSNRKERITSFVLDSPK